jgi:enoyl-CoA hydratase/carnithine racemase
MPDDVVVLERDARVGVVLMNRPKQLNALSGELMSAVVAALQELDADPEIRAIVLGGGERAFAAGADIAELAAGTPTPGTRFETCAPRSWRPFRASVSAAAASLRCSAT